MHSYPGEFAGTMESMYSRWRRRPRPAVSLTAGALLLVSSTITLMLGRTPAFHGHLLSVPVLSIHLNPDSASASRTRTNAPCLLQSQVPNQISLPSSDPAGWQQQDCIPKMTSFVSLPSICFHLFFAACAGVGHKSNWAIMEVLLL